MKDDREKYTRELLNGAPTSGGVNSGSVVGKVGEKVPRKGRIMALIIGGVVGLCFIIIGLIALGFSGGQEEEVYVKEKTQVSIFVAPVIAETKLNGEVYKNGLYEIEPGMYEVEITAYGYKPRAYNFEVKQDRISLLYDYLDKETEGGFTEDEVDVMRFLANDDDVVRKVDDCIDGISADYVFNSELNSPVRNYEKLKEVYGDSLNDYSYRLMKEVLNGYFYFARSDTRNVWFIEDSFGEIAFKDNEYATSAEFKVTADNRETYRVMMEITRPEDEPEAPYEVWRGTILTEAGTALFQYDGSFLHDILTDEELEEIFSDEEADWH